MPAESRSSAAVASATASFFTDCLRINLRYAGMLVKDIPAERFAHMPHPTMNHPAFCLGHLSIYPNRVLEIIGRGDLVVEKPGYVELFTEGVKCVEQDGRYPPKDEIVAYFTERHGKLLDAMLQVPDEVLQQETDVHPMFSTVGTAVNFMLNNHMMLHLGQISAWRRAANLSPVM